MNVPGTGHRRLTHPPYLRLCRALPPVDAAAAEIVPQHPYLLRAAASTNPKGHPMDGESTVYAALLLCVLLLAGLFVVVIAITIIVVLTATWSYLADAVQARKERRP